jgi:hypothetical protein
MTDILRSSTPRAVDVDLRDPVTMGGKQVGACSNIVRLILDMFVSLLRGTRSAFVMIA